MCSDRNSNRRKFRPAKILFFTLMAVLFVAVFGSIVMWLWNAILPDVLGVKPINWWQAIGIFVLFKILFGGFGGHRWKHKSNKIKRRMWEKKWMNSHFQKVLIVAHQNGHNDPSFGKKATHDARGAHSQKNVSFVAHEAALARFPRPDQRRTWPHEAILDEITSSHIPTAT